MRTLNKWASDKINTNLIEFSALPIHFSCLILKKTKLNIFVGLQLLKIKDVQKVAVNVNKGK